MYCPQCATPNTDGARFCRSCGLELEGVALVLSSRSAQPDEVGRAKSQSKTAEEWLDKRGAAVKSISTGVSLLVVSVLIGVAMAVFMPAKIPWMLAWVIFVGWMTMWGGIAVATGISGLLEAKSRLRRLGLGAKDYKDNATPKQLSPAGQPSSVSSHSPASMSSPSSSVTEGTTRHLDNSVEK